MFAEAHNRSHTVMQMVIDMDQGAKIKVIGVGGGGGNAVNNMIAKELEGVDFIVANTDAQALENSKFLHQIQARPCSSVLILLMFQWYSQDMLPVRRASCVPWKSSI